jgi:putative two-component system response regulator
MIVDDEPFNVLVVRKFLQQAGYTEFVTTSDADAALRLVERHKPDLVILDVVMPQISGLEILQLLRDDPRSEHLPVLILTASIDAATKQRALELGATDFLSKPLDPNDLAPRVRNALVTKLYQDRLARHAEELEDLVRQRTAELVASREEVIHCLARAAEFRDSDTGCHIVRVGRYAGIIARQLGFSTEQVELLELAAQLHDIGKIGIPDAILLKPGALDPDEVAIVQRHCAVARQIIQPLSGAECELLRSHTGLGGKLLNASSSPLLVIAAQIAQSHHERWDGTGYPLGLAGDDIPLEGRITAVADVYDALSSARPYKRAMSREKCFDALRLGRGTHFDPKVLDAFFARSEDIVQVQLELMDV